MRFALLGLAMLLALVWLFAFALFHVAGFFIHLLIIAAVIIFILDLVRPSPAP